MSRTIDVEGGPRPDPFETGAPQRPSRGRRRDPSSKAPVVVTVAAVVFGLLLIVGLMMSISGKLGVANIDAQEVAVKINYLTGEEEVINTPGFTIYVPFVEEVFAFDKRTQDFLMEGSKYIDANHVPQLTVRASDGSNFVINDLRIQYEIVPGDAGVVLGDSGRGDGYKQEWIKGYARSILRDEFGRYTAVEVADPTVYKQAPLAARERLNELLGPHGIQITLIKTPNPRFDKEYEDAIEARKQADQEVQRLEAQVEQLEQEKQQRLAAVERQKGVEMQELQGELVRARRAAEADSIRIKLAADEYATKRSAQGEALRNELLAQARGLEVRYRKEAEGIASKAQALEERGEVVVREAIINKLMDITFTLVPYSRDPAPKRLEHVDGRPTDAMRVDESVLGGGL